MTRAWPRVSSGGAQAMMLVCRMTFGPSVPPTPPFPPRLARSPRPIRMVSFAAEGEIRSRQHRGQPHARLFNPPHCVPVEVALTAVPAREGFNVHKEDVVADPDLLVDRSEEHTSELQSRQYLV